MKSRGRLIAWLVLGILIACAPIWAMLGGATAMILIFSDMQSGAASNPYLVAPHISMALHAAILALIACPLGILITVIASIRLGRWQGALRTAKDTPNHTSDGIRQPADGSPKP